MLHTTVVIYDTARWPAEQAEAHVRAVAALVFPEADGFDHASIKPYMPGHEQRLPNGQVFCRVLVDCRKHDAT